MEFLPSLSPAAMSWLSGKGYRVLGILGKGRSAGVWKVQKGRLVRAAKIEHAKSFRTQMSAREVQMMALANERGLGPRLYDYDASARLVLMEFIEGRPLAEWILGCTSPSRLETVLRNLFRQAQLLDEAGLDHGQLGGKLHNILVSSHDLVVILDFEKASYVRKTRNVRKLRADLFHTQTRVARHIHSLSGPAIERSIFGNDIYSNGF